MAHKSFWGPPPLEDPHAGKAHAALAELLGDVLRPGFTGTASIELSVKQGGIVGAPAITTRRLAEGKPA